MRMAAKSWRPIAAKLPIVKPHRSGLHMPRVRVRIHLQRSWRSSASPRLEAARRRHDTEVIDMPSFEHAGVSLYYEEFGSGYPLLLFAPGGMRSSIDFWHKSPFDPTREFAADFRVIAMDQRNAGRSRAPIGSLRGWDAGAAHHLALPDHLGAPRGHVVGGCIGS